MKTDYQRQTKYTHNRKKKHLFGSNEIHTYRNKFCQIEIFLTIILYIYDVKKIIKNKYINYFLNIN
jgi:hypothetical protein